MKTKYFAGEFNGINAALDAHRDQRIKLNKEISLYESKGDKTEFDLIRIRALRGFLRLVEESEAEVASNVGKPNKTL
jgi:hypothetical protein